jgi:V/A-type H+-transporting ATPase subunit C
MVINIEKINFIDSYKYVYVTTRISGMKRRLVTQEKFRSMLNSKSLDELNQFFDNTDYKKIPYKNLEESNKFLDECFIQLLDKISFFAPSAIKEYIFVLKEYIRLQDLKLVVKCIITNDKRSLDLLSPLTKIQSNINGLEILEIKEFKKFKKSVLKYIEKKEFNQMSYELENQFFKSIKKTIYKRKLTIVKNFMKERADILNIVIKLRSLLLGSDVDCYLDYGFINPRKIKDKKSIDEFISFVDHTTYHAIFSKIMDEFNKTGNQSVLDRVIDEFLIEFSKKAKSSDPSGFGFVFWFILEKDREIRKLKAMFKIINDNLSKDYFEVFAW